MPLLPRPNQPLAPDVLTTQAEQSFDEIQQQAIAEVTLDLISETHARKEQLINHQNTTQSKIDELPWDDPKVDELVKEHDTTGNKLWTDSDESEALRTAKERLVNHRETYAEQLANRQANTVFNNGRSLNKGVKHPSIKALRKNPQFMYEVYVGAVDRLTVQTTATRETDAATQEKARKLAVIEAKLGTDANPQNGEMFKLNEAVRNQRLLKSGTHKRVQHPDGTYNVVEKKPGILNTQRQRFYNHWNKLSESGRKRDKLQKAAIIGAFGVPLGLAVAAATPIIGATGVIAGSGVALTSRIGRAMAVNKIESGASGLRATAEAELIEAAYTAAHITATTQVENGGQHWAFAGNRLGIRKNLAENFTNEANKQARSNKRRVMLGALAVGGAAFASASAVVGPTHVVEHLLDKKFHNPFGNGDSGSSSTSTEPAAPPAGSPPVKPSSGGNGSGVAPKGPRMKTIDLSNNLDKYTSQSYERVLGHHRGFLEMIHAAHGAIKNGDLVKVSDQTDPNKFWYKVTSKAAKHFGQVNAGSTQNSNVLRVLNHYSTKTHLVR